MRFDGEEDGELDGDTGEEEERHNTTMAGSEQLLSPSMDLKRIDLFEELPTRVEDD